MTCILPCTCCIPAPVPAIAIPVPIPIAAAYGLPPCALRRPRSPSSRSRIAPPRPLTGLCRGPLVPRPAQRPRDRRLRPARRRGPGPPLHRHRRRSRQRPLLVHPQIHAPAHRASEHLPRAHPRPPLLLRPRVRILRRPRILRLIQALPPHWRPLPLRRPRHAVRTSLHPVPRRF
jgi:hypothetical protein